MIKMAWQDAHGCIWMATDAGLVRFDGRRTTTLTDIPSLFVKGILQPRALHGRRLNTLVLTDLGIVAIDGDDAHPTHVQPFLLGTSQRSDTTIFRPKSWHEDRRGTIWVGEQDAIVRLSINRTSQTGSIARRYKFAETYWSDHVVRSFVFAEDPTGRLYAASQRGATLFYYNQATDAFTPVALANATAAPFLRISALLVRPTGALWAGTDKGIFELPMHKPHHEWRWRLVAVQRDVSCLAQDPAGRVTAGTWYDGLLSVNETTAAPEKITALTSNTINDIHIDHDGSLWISTDDGLKLIQPAALHQFRSVFERPYIQVVASDTSGRVLATDGVRIIRFNTASTHQMRFASSAMANSETLFTIPDNEQGIAMSLAWRGNELLYGTSLGGVYSIRAGRARKIIQLQSVLTVFAICNTPDGSLWVSQDLPEGITRIFPNGTTKLYGAAQGLGSQAIILRTTANGTLLAGGRGRNYLSRYDTASDRFVAIAAALPFEHRVAGAELAVSDMAISGDTLLWLATNWGLFRHTLPSTSRPAMMNTVALPREIAHRAIKAVRLTSSGEVLFTTNQQLHQHLPSGHIVSTDLYLGTTAMTSTSRNLAVDAQGNIWLGATQGLLAFERLPRPNMKTSTPVFVHIKANDSAVQHSITSSLHLALQYPTGTFIAAEYAAPTYPAERVRYQTRLLGKSLNASDSAWSESSFDGTVLLPSLSAGTYTLHVRAQQTGMIWSAPAELHFIIVAPWYASWWAWLLYVLAGGGVLYGVSKWRSRRLEQKNLVLKRIVAERTAEIEHQLVILDEQARSIELANSRLQEQNVALQELNNEKNEFLGMAAHDLKNPLTTIMMSSSMINRYAKDMRTEDIMSQMQGVERTAKRMRDIITNLLDINAIEMGKFKFDLQPVNASGSISDLVTVYRTRAIEKNITLHFEPPAEEIWIRSDETALTEIVENIVSNALKYSPPNKNVWVTIVGDQLMPNAPSEAGFPPARRTLIAVRDEGPGLTEEDMGKLFTKFGRLSAKPTGGEHSTGLGLSIVKRMVEAMNGRVWCESQVGQGATFIVEFPQEFPPALATDAARTDNTARNEAVAQTVEKDGQTFTNYAH
jgi:signal transduction histidine kinase/ligand-binding sensor domain-containing protein